VGPFTCGAIDADRVVAELITGLRLTGTRVHQVRRDTARCCLVVRATSSGVPVTEGMRNGHLAEARGWLPLIPILWPGGRRESWLAWHSARPRLAGADG
jgi:hypothetical protein